MSKESELGVTLTGDDIGQYAAQRRKRQEVRNRRRVWVLLNVCQLFGN